MRSKLTERAHRRALLVVTLSASTLTFVACGDASQESHLTAVSKPTKIKVDYSCEETSEATKWLQVGLRLTDGPAGVEAIVVEHDDDAPANGAGKLIRREAVKFSLDRKSPKTLSVFTGSTVKVSFDESMNGELTVIANGPGSRVRSKLDCFKSTDVAQQFITIKTK
jgi:hypothetical protein